MKCLCGESVGSLFIFPSIPQCVMELGGSLRHQDVFVRFSSFQAPICSLKARQHLPMRMDPRVGRSPVLLEHSVQSN